MPNVLNTAGANDLLRQAIEDLLSNKMDPRQVSALVQLVNCFQRINQQAELEARLARLEEARNVPAGQVSEENFNSADAPATDVP